MEAFAVNLEQLTEKNAGHMARDRMGEKLIKMGDEILAWNASPQLRAEYTGLLSSMNVELAFCRQTLSRKRQSQLVQDEIIKMCNKSIARAEGIVLDEYPANQNAKSILALRQVCAALALFETQAVPLDITNAVLATAKPSVRQFLANKTANFLIGLGYAMELHRSKGITEQRLLEAMKKIDGDFQKWIRTGLGV